MKRHLLKWLFCALALVVSSIVVSFFGLPFTVETGSFAKMMPLLLGVVVLSLINATLGKILKLITLPLNCLTLGLFALLINAGIFYWVGSMDLGFKVGSVPAAFVGSIVYSSLVAIFSSLLPDKNDE
jgi:putative membrane protein